MKLKLWAGFAALSAVALAAQARQHTRAPDPADPSLAVPATVYESVLDGQPAPVTGTQTPDKSWRAANDALTGHHSSASVPVQEAPRQPAPVASPKDRHKHHRAGADQ